MEHCLFVKQNFQIPSQFKVACVTAGALWVLVVPMKVLMRMREAKFLIFLCLSSLFWWEHHLLLCSTFHLVATLISSEPVLLSHRPLLPHWPVKNQRFY